MKLAFGVTVLVWLLAGLDAVFPNSLRLSVEADIPGNIVNFRCIGAVQGCSGLPPATGTPPRCIGAVQGCSGEPPATGTPPRPPCCYFKLNFSRGATPMRVDSIDYDGGGMNLNYTLSPSTEAIFFCECETANGTISTKGVYYAAIQDQNKVESLDVYRNKQVNLKCPFLLGNLHMTAKPYEICWRNSTCSDGSECCLKNNSKLSVSDRNLTIIEVLNNQIYSCSLYLERCEYCRTNLFGNVSYEINVFDVVESANTSVVNQEVAVLEGNDVNINCTSIGGPTPTVRWTFNNSNTFSRTDVVTHPQRGSDRNVTLGRVISTLHIVNAQYPANDGVYICIGSNNFNSTNASVTVQVQVLPRVMLEVMDRSRVRLGEAVTLTCTVVRGNPPSYSFQWYHNGMPTSSTSETSTTSTLVIDSVMASNTGTYECNVTNEAGTKSQSVDISIGQPPEVSLPYSSTVVLSNSVVTLVCNATQGDNHITFMWTGPDGNMLDMMMISSNNYSSEVTISTAEASVFGSYTCLATNSFGSSNGSLTLFQANGVFMSSSPQLSPTSTKLYTRSVTTVAASVSVTVVMIVIISLVASTVFFAYKCKRKKGLNMRKHPDIGDIIYQSNDVKCSSDNPPSLPPSFPPSLPPSLPLSGALFQLIYEDIASSSALSDALIPFQSLSLTKKIGQGAFGTVFKGVLKYHEKEIIEIEVAVKTIKNSSASYMELKGLLEESVIMCGFDHPHVLGLIGISLDPSNSPHLLLPFMENGDLRTYLKNRRKNPSFTDKQYIRGLELDTLVRLCLEVADGMEYISAKKLVHRDLATRNCMVDGILSVRVADFGLTRDIYETDYYRQSQQGRVPVKWMAPESLHDRISNEKTDVWSYGVTCWEIFSLGRTPYPTIPNPDMIEYLENGGRLRQPILCPNAVYDVISKCWRDKPHERPNFSELQWSLKICVSELKSDSSSEQMQAVPEEGQEYLEVL